MESTPKSCTQKRTDGRHSHWLYPWHQRSQVCVADSNKCWICVLFLLPVSGALMWSGWLKLMDQKPAHSAHGLTLYTFTFIMSLPLPHPTTSGLSGIKVHSMRVSEEWNQEWCHYIPHLISRTFNQVLQGIMYHVCIILKSQHRHVFKRSLHDLHKLCIFLVKWQQNKNNKNHG